jgi:hypothetical protein
MVVFRYLAAVSILTGCAITRPPLDFERTVIENEAEAYEVVSATFFAKSMAIQLADECPTVAFNFLKAERYEQAVMTEVETWIGDDPARLKAMEDQFGRRSGDDFALGGGVMFDTVANVTGYVARRGIDIFTPEGACEAARQEIASRSLIGSFLLDELGPGPVSRG